MKQHFGRLFCALFIISLTIISWRPLSTTLYKKHVNVPSSAKELFEKYISNIYMSAHLEDSGLDLDVLKKGITGFINLKLSSKVPQQSSIITLIDLSKPSSEKRMWIIDVVKKELLLNTWVAHGEGSGDGKAYYFSDRQDSHASSLGFYLTDNVYYGKHGRSLKLEGLDMGFNGNARSREIVVHAAKYVSEGTIAKIGYLGRSYGCPAVSPAVADVVISTIKDNTVMFINGYDESYFSKYLNEDQAADFVSQNYNDVVLATL